MESIIIRGLSEIKLEMKLKRERFSRCDTEILYISEVVQLISLVYSQAVILLRILL